MSMMHTPHVSAVLKGFLKDFPGLVTIDLGALSRITEVAHGYFLHVRSVLPSEEGAFTPFQLLSPPCLNVCTFVDNSNIVPLLILLKYFHYN